MKIEQPVIALTGVNMVREKKQVLTDVSLTVGRGDFIAVTGPNGGGKTTLLRIMLKLLKPTSGTVSYFDEEGRLTDRLSVGYLPQKNMIDARFPITVREVVELGIAGESRLSKAERRDLVGEMIDLVGLADKAGASLGSLSGGQLQRALMARAIISRPSVLVLDEPLSYVDRRFERRVYEIVESLSKSTTIILVSHDMTTIASMANRHLIVDRTIEACHFGSHFLHYDCCDGH